MALIDYAAALKRLGNDTGLLREMAKILLEDAPERLAEFRSAMQKRDFQTAGRAAHALKGLALNFGAQRAAKAGEALERASSTSHLDFDAAAAELEEAFAELLPVIEQLAHADHGPYEVRSDA